MKRALTISGCCAIFLAVSSVAAAGAPAADAASCADPAADLEVALISKTGPTSGRVRITGIVKNLGSAGWTATSSAHRLQMVLAQKNSDARPNGEAAEPPVAIAQLAPGQQFRIDHQMDWEVNVKASSPVFIVSFFNVGRVGATTASDRLDCRTDNNRKEITPADINRLFVPPSPGDAPLSIQSYRLLGGVGVNTVETTLDYRRVSAAAAKLTAAVSAPYRGVAEEVPIAGKAGRARIRVNIPCERRDPSNPLPKLTVTYRLWGRLGQPGTANWVAGFSTRHSIPYSEICE